MVEQNDIALIKYGAIIKSPLIYQQISHADYGVDELTGEIYSIKRGSWVPLSIQYPKKNRNGGLYPTFVVSSPLFTSAFKAKVMLVHVAAHETLNPRLPIPDGITKIVWLNTDPSVKALCRGLWQVNHIDHDRLNFHPSNLEWVSASTNIQKYGDHLKLKNIA
jgi:hypothetical protein